jgi:hypothetical protein
MKVNKRTILRTDLSLESCSQKDEDDFHNHQNGCYIRFKEGCVVKSKQIDDCIIDYDENGEIIGIEFYEGL